MNNVVIRMNELFDELADGQLTIDSVQFIFNSLYSNGYACEDLDNYRDEYREYEFLRWAIDNGFTDLETAKSAYILMK